MAENMQADFVQSRQAGFVRCCLKRRYKALSVVITFCIVITQLLTMSCFAESGIGKYNAKILNSLDVYFQQREMSFVSSDKNNLNNIVETIKNKTVLDEFEKKAFWVNCYEKKVDIDIAAM